MFTQVFFVQIAVVPPAELLAVDGRSHKYSDFTWREVLTFRHVRIIQIDPKDMMDQS